MATDVRPRAYFTRWYLGSDGSRTALCTLHVRKRVTFGGVEYEPEAEKALDDACDLPCVDCVERERTKGDAYDLSLGEHLTSIAENCDVAHDAIEDIISTLEICAGKVGSDEQVELVTGWQKQLRACLDFIDTSLNEKYSLSSKFSDLIDEIEGGKGEDY